jgi:hypothetical protein
LTQINASQHRKVSHHGNAQIHHANHSTAPSHIQTITRVASTCCKSCSKIVPLFQIIIYQFFTAPAAAAAAADDDAKVNPIWLFAQT